MKTLTAAVILAAIGSAHAADLPLGEPCDSCDIGPYIEQQCSDDMTQVLLMSTWFMITNPKGETVPVYGNVCVQPEEEGGFYEDDFEGIWHDVGFTLGAFGGGFAGGGGGGGGGSGLPFVLVSTAPALVTPPFVPHHRHHGTPPAPTVTPPVTPPAVPIPGTLWLFGSALLGLGAMAWRRRRA